LLLAGKQQRALLSKLVPASNGAARVCCVLLQVVRSNKIGARGAHALAKGLTALTCLDLASCPIGKRTTKQLAHLLAPALDLNDCPELDTSCW
jgi:hypothetical protein